MELSLHFITDFLAIAVGVQLYVRSKVDDTVRGEDRTFILIGALIGAFIGSRLIAALEDPSLFLNPPSFLYYYLNKTILGGIAGGILGVELFKKIAGITAWTGDRTLVPLGVAIIIGRIGCFFTGVADGTVGGPCTYAWCLEQGDGILRHPNSLYEIAFVTLFLVVYFAAQHFKPRVLHFILETRGAFFRLFIVDYFSLRFFIEFLKETHPLLWGLNSIQIVCLLFIIWYMRDLIRVFLCARTKKENLLV